MRRRPVLLPLLGLLAPLVACSDGKVPGESGGRDSRDTTSGADSSNPSDSSDASDSSDTSRPGDSADSSDTGAPAGPPNVVFILGEARGWVSTSVVQDLDRADSASDLFLTPNLERLAARGTTFAQFYAPSPRCMPSRAAYLTGKSPAQLHMTFIPEGRDDGAVDGDVVAPDTVTDLPTSEVTIAALLKEQGYTTAHYGKWHVGHTDPAEYGFDESDGPTTNKGPDGEESPNPEEGDETTARGVDFMERAVAAGTPFYLQISNYGGDDVEDASPEAYADANVRLAGESEDDICEAACITDMDDNIGTILDSLAALGVEGNTVVFFSADHGRSGKNANRPLNQGKGTVYEGGVRVPLIIAGPGVAENAHTEVRASQVDLFPTLAAMAGATALPEGLEGGSLEGVLSGAGATVDRPREELVVHFPHYDKDELGPATSILSGDLKLIRYYEDGSLRLYDLASDLEESTDLSASRPDDAAALEALMDDYLSSVDAQLPEHL